MPGAAGVLVAVAGDQKNPLSQAVAEVGADVDVEVGLQLPLPPRQ